MPASISRRIYYTGRVQGVGFRYSVKQIAAGFDVVGSVRNLADGRVELEATGTRAEIDAFLEGVASSHLGTHLRQVEQVEVETPVSRVKGFEIKP